MLERTRIEVGFGLSDSELDYFRKDDDGLRLVLKSWDESRIVLLFTDVIRVLDNDLNGVSSIWEVTERSDFIANAFARVYEGDVPHAPEFKHVQLIDEDGVVAFEIACKTISISRE